MLSPKKDTQDHPNKFLKKMNYLNLKWTDLK